MMSALNTFLPLLNLVISIFVVFGGIMAFRNGYGKQTAEIQDRVINALKDEIEVLRGKVEGLEKDRATQDRVVSTIRHVLKQYGLRIVISGDYVTVQDSAGKSKTTRIQNKPTTSKAADDDDEDADN